MADNMFQFCFGTLLSSIKEKVIVTPFFSLDRFAEYCMVTDRFKGSMYAGINAEKNGTAFTIIKCGIGDRLLGDAVILLSEAEINNVLFVGTCGALKDIKVGELIVAENALDGEGFSRYYYNSIGINNILSSGTLVPSAGEYVEELKQFLPEEVTAHAGNIFTIGSLMAEDKDTIFEIDSEGFIAVEMELSAVYQAAKSKNISAAGLLLASDRPVDRPIWEKKSQDEKKYYFEGMKKLIKLSVNFISK